MEKQNSYSHILKYTSIFGGVQMLNILIGLLRNKLVALILGPMGMGLIALFSSTIKLVGDATNLGISISAVRDISRAFESGDEKELSYRISVFRHWCVLTALLGGVVCAALSPLLSSWTFSFGNHTLHFLLLSPVVVLSTLSMGELAIMKATRRLGEVAASSVYTAIGTFFVAVPIYYLWGYKGIVPSLVLLAVVQMAAVAYYSLKAYPLRLSFRRSTLADGRGFMKLGMSFALAGIAGSGAEMFIRAYLSYVDNVDTVGLYNAAYVMIFTYAGMIFTAMETDYYPRLSSEKSLGCRFNHIVNNQIEVSLHLVAPMIAAFILLMPILLPLMYSGKFVAVVPMIQIAALSMLSRAMYMPIEYIALSRGDSLAYFVTEAVSYAVLVALVILGYNIYGLWGAGLGIALSSFVEFVYVLVFCGVRYRYRMSAELVKITLVHFALCLLVYAATYIEDLVLYSGVGLLLFLADFTYMYRAMRRHVDVWGALKAKIKKRKE